MLTCLMMFFFCTLRNLTFRISKLDKRSELKIKSKVKDIAMVLLDDSRYFAVFLIKNFICVLDLQFESIELEIITLPSIFRRKFINH